MSIVEEFFQTIKNMWHSAEAKRFLADVAEHRIKFGDRHLGLVLETEFGRRFKGLQTVIWNRPSYPGRLLANSVNLETAKSLLEQAEIAVIMRSGKIVFSTGSVANFGLLNVVQDFRPLPGAPIENASVHLVNGVISACGNTECLFPGSEQEIVEAQCPEAYCAPPTTGGPTEQAMQTRALNIALAAWVLSCGQDYANVAIAEVLSVRAGARLPYTAIAFNACEKALKELDFAKVIAFAGQFGARTNISKITR
jgi:hypothetical protein